MNQLFEFGICFSKGGSAGLSRVQNEISGSDSDSVRTSGSSGTKRKIPDLKKNGSTRYNL